MSACIRLGKIAQRARELQRIGAQRRWFCVVSDSPEDFDGLLRQCIEWASVTAAVCAAIEKN